MYGLLRTGHSRGKRVKGTTTAVKSVPKSYFETRCAVDIFAQTGKIFKQLRGNTYIKLSLTLNKIEGI